MRLNLNLRLSLDKMNSQYVCLLCTCSLVKAELPEKTIEFFPRSQRLNEAKSIDEKREKCQDPQNTTPDREGPESGASRRQESQPMLRQERNLPQQGNSAGTRMPILHPQSVRRSLRATLKEMKKLRKTKRETIEQVHVQQSSFTFNCSSPKHPEAANVKLSVTGSHEKDDSSHLLSENVNATVAPSSGDGVDSEHPNGRSELAFPVNRRSKTRPHGAWPYYLKWSDLSIYFCLSVVDAAKKLRICTTSLKKVCQKFRHERWLGP